MGCSLHAHYLYHYLGYFSRRQSGDFFFFRFFSKKNGFVNQFVFCIFHYENTPILIYRKFRLQKLKIFRVLFSKLGYFIFLLQTQIVGTR